MNYSPRLRKEVERLKEERDSNAAIVEKLAERVNHELGDYGAYCRAMDESTSEDTPEQQALLDSYLALVDRLVDGNYPWLPGVAEGRHRMGGSAIGGWVAPEPDRS